MLHGLGGVKENYISYGMKYDTALKSYLQQIPIEHSQEALTYVGINVVPLSGYNKWFCDCDKFCVIFLYCSRIGA